MIASLLFCMCQSVSAQNVAPADVLSVTYEQVPNTAPLGGTVQGRIVVNYPHHLLAGAGVSSATPGVTVRSELPKGVVKVLGGEKATVYDSRVEIPVWVTVPNSPGAADLLVRVNYRRVNRDRFGPQESVTLGMTLTVK